MSASHGVQRVAIGAVLLGFALTYSWMQRPMRTTEAFAGDVFFERYEEASLMLRSPSALKVASDGARILIDHDGESTTVPATKLPFIAGGHPGAIDHDFMMTALGSSTDGVLDSPAVILYLSVDGGKVRIEGVDHS